MGKMKMRDVEAHRLAEDARRETNWKRWGPYLAERQWSTVCEDYSPDGSAWEYFPHDHARSCAYRWGEDGLLAITGRGIGASHQTGWTALVAQCIEDLAQIRTVGK